MTVHEIMKPFLAADHLKCTQKGMKMRYILAVWLVVENDQMTYIHETSKA